ncbi:MAG TPA: hypothetical protein VHP83_16345 [Aggregatilineaceae bacterium]|nr:hypothetical protein [Aggregatilineaceae bacterium]
MHSLRLDGWIRFLGVILLLILVVSGCADDADDADDTGDAAVVLFGGGHPTATAPGSDTLPPEVEETLRDYIHSMGREENWDGVILQAQKATAQTYYDEEWCIVYDPPLSDGQTRATVVARQELLWDISGDARWLSPRLMHDHFLSLGCSIWMD